MFDAVNVIVDAFNRLFQDKPFLFGNRFAPLYSQEDHSIVGIDCSKQYPIAQWKHGKIISEYLKKVCCKTVAVPVLSMREFLV